MPGIIVDQPCEAIAETLSATRSTWAGVAGFQKLGPPTKTPKRRLIYSETMTQVGKRKLVLKKKKEQHLQLTFQDVMLRYGNEWGFQRRERKTFLPSFPAVALGSSLPDWGG